MRPSFLVFSGLVALFASPGTAIRAVPSQQCASACGDVTRTSSSDIVCSNADFQNTPKGQILQNCLSCQQNSTANDPNTGESDLRWFMYNLRYTMSSCLWGYPDNSSALSTPCTTAPACGLYQTNMEYDFLASNASTFDYCSGFDARATVQQPRCLSCLQQLSDDFFISNIFTVLVAGCQQRPYPGSLLSLQGSIFSTTSINITNPQVTTSAVASTQSFSGLTLGAMVGAAIGGLVAILTILGCCVVWCGKRRRRQVLQRAQARLSHNGVRPASGNIEPKWGQDAPGGWVQDDTPTTAGGYGSDKQNFSPYSSRYTSPVSARDMLNPKSLWDAHQQNMGTMMEAPGVNGPGRKDETFEMEKIRDQRIEERRIRELQLHDEFMQDAAERGFTTAPIIRLPSIGKAGHG